MDLRLSDATKAYLHSKQIAGTHKYSCVRSIIRYAEQVGLDTRASVDQYEDADFPVIDIENMLEYGINLVPVEHDYVVSRDTIPEPIKNCMGDLVARVHEVFFQCVQYNIEGVWKIPIFDEKDNVFRMIYTTEEDFLLRSDGSTPLDVYERLIKLRKAHRNRDKRLSIVYKYANIPY
jgi:hypothetical protein